MTDDAPSQPEEQEQTAPATNIKPFDTSKTIWNRLDDWGRLLARWQRFIISHAVRDGMLTDEQVNESYRLFLRDKGLDTGAEILPEIPASITGRAGTSNVNSLILEKMGTLKNVNAIPEASTLTFSRGLTVIYGSNGAGKSGFARMLSSACFSRSKPKIIPNIYGDRAMHAPATAEFLVTKGNEESEAIAFTVGDEHADLQRISVFDSSVARIHLAKESEFRFRPAGFDVFDEFIRVVNIILTKINDDIVLRRKPNKFNQFFTDPSPITEKISNLTAQSNIAHFQALGVFGQDEQDELDEVMLKENKMLAKSPIETLQALAVAREDIENLQKKMLEIVGSLGDSNYAKWRAMLDEHREAIIIKAKMETVTHPNLTKIASDEWDVFIEAGRTLGQLERENYPAEGDPCLLCHRPLDEPSATLIKRMWGYLDSAARTAAIAADDKINICIKNLQGLDHRLLPEDSRIRSELSKINPSLVETLDIVSITFKERKEAIIAAIDAGQADRLPADELKLPSEKIKKALLETTEQEASLEGNKFNETIMKLKAKRVELQQRQVLKNNIKDVTAFIKDLQWIEKAEMAKPNKRFVTDKQSELFHMLIESKYKERLEEECRKLSCTLPIKFKAQGRGGKTIRGWKVQGDHKPEEIFSEGEQRGLALADFLTEVNLDPANAAIVFDDPVTSMDHRRKKLIACRLANEAKNRQVVIFTHDLVFLSNILDSANKSTIDSICHTIDRRDEHPGHVLNNESPANSNTYRSTERAKDFLDRAKKNVGREKVDCIRQGAGALRKTIEEAVIQHLFKGVVRRWNEDVRLGRISAINWSDEIVEEVGCLFEETSRLLEGHSNSDEFSGGMPDVSDLEDLIARVNSFIKKVKPERKG